MTNNLDVIQILGELVAINSVNPSYEGGVPEADVALYVERYFAAHGISTFRQEVLPGRFNVIARIPGRQPHRRRPTGIKPIQLPLICHPDQRKRIPANACRSWLNNAQRRHRRHGRIHRIATPVQHLQPRLRR